MRASRPVLLVGAVALLVLAAGAFLLTRSAAAPGAVAPRFPEKVDSEVMKLIAERTAEIERDPRDATAHGRLGLVYEANLMWLEARDSYARAIELAPAETAWRMRWSDVARRAGDPASALAELRRLAVDDPESAPVRQRLGLALLETGEVAPAEAAFRRVIELAPDSPAGYAGLGDSLVRQRKFGPATEALEKALTLAPSYRAARYQLGLAYRGLGDLEAARRELTLGAEARPHYLPDRWTEEMSSYAIHRTVHINRAAELLAAGRAAEAVSIIEARLAESPSSTKLLNKLAVALMRIDDYQRAGEALSRALAIDDREFRTHVNLAWWALGQRRAEVALEHTRAALELGPEVAEAHSIHARALTAAGREGEAVGSLEQSVRLDPGDEELYSRLSDLYSRLGREDDLEVLLLGAIDRWPDLVPARLGLARLWLRQGRLPEAEAQLAVIRQLAPQSRQLALMTRQIQHQRAAAP